MVKALAGDLDVIRFPITSHRESSLFAGNLLNSKNIGAILSIERAGLLNDGTYRNWRGEDFSEYNAKIDHLFDQHPYSNFLNQHPLKQVLNQVSQRKVLLI